jgi:putative membrane protein
LAYSHRQMALFPWFLWLHVSGNLVWIGSTVAVGFLLGRAPEQARWLYLRIVNPSQLVAIVFGLGLLLMDFGHYMHQHWMHGKLFVAIIAIGLTHVLGARARRQSSAAGGAAGENMSSSRQADAVGANLTLAFLVCAVLAVAFVTVLRTMMS